MDGENIGDWLYILFLIIAGISSMLGSKKKKKQPKHILGQPGGEIVANEEIPNKELREILEEMQKQKPVTCPLPTPKRKQKKQPVAKPTPFLAGEMTDRPSSSGNSLTASPNEEGNRLADIEFDNAEELRKAVIYTEILNRKY